MTVDPGARGLAASALRPNASGIATFSGAIPSTGPIGPRIQWAGGLAGGEPVISVAGATFNSVRDPAIYIGVNQTAYGTLINSSYQGLSYALENNYHDGVSIKQEGYLQMLFTDGGSIRPFFWQVEPSTKLITGMRVRAGSLGFQILDDAITGQDVGGNNIATFQLGTATIYPPAAADTTLNVKAVTAQNAALWLGRAGTDGYFKIGPFGAEVATVTLNGTTPLYLYSKAQGTTGAVAIAVGEGNNVGAGFFRAGFAGHKGLVAKAFSSGQTGNLLETRDASDNPLFYVDAKGLPVLPVFTVATLPTGRAAYTRAFVSDASAPTWNATVSGGGAVKCPVWYDGAAWKVG